MDKIKDCCGIWEKFDLENNLIKNYEHWTVLVKSNQAFLGACVAITNKHHDLLGELSPEEMAEYQLVAKEMEDALKKAFDYDGIHHVLLMKKDKHTHFHIIPRYVEKREFQGEIWKDGYGPFIPGNERRINKELSRKIKSHIRSCVVITN